MASCAIIIEARIAAAAVFAAFVNVCVPAVRVDLLVAAKESYYAIASACTPKAILKKDVSAW